MKAIKEIEDEIVEEFEWIEDPLDRYQMIMDSGDQLETMPNEYKTEATLVKGCQSKVWLFPKMMERKIHFLADSETKITKGIVSILLRVLNDREANEIIDYNMDIIERIDLKSHLTSQRSNGLQAMINKIKMYAKNALDE